jgi:PqqD family protein of HPr-rel-A system
MEAGAAESRAAGLASDRLGRWVVPCAEQLLWMADGVEAVVFDRRSRQTHVLNEAAVVALKALLKGPLDVSELARCLGDPLDYGIDTPAAELAQQVLSTFDTLGLVEPAGL